MKDNAVRTIICSVRGQPESRETVTRAIDLALEHNARLVFCLIIDAEFLGQAPPTMAPLQAVYRQLEDMGTFSMLILCDRAKRRGVQDVDYLIRRGNTIDQLRLLVSEIDPEIMVLGRPIRGASRSVFTLAKFDKFVESLEDETNIRVVQVVHRDNI